MPWPERRPPTLEELILYVVGRSRDRGATLTRTKLVKLVYLIDVARAEGLGRTLTGLRWRFLHYGPYAPELGSMLEDLESREAIFGGSFGDATLYRGARDVPDADTWPASIGMSVNRVVDEWAGAELNKLLDYVYFHTMPMRGIHRGDELDFSAIERERPHSKLEPPVVSGDLREGLEGWRLRRSRLVDAPDLPNADLPEESSAEEGVRGRASVKEDVEL
jgi:Protein of unknown function (DUF4065)